MHDDPWIKEHSPIGVERTHALGFLTFAWNLAEYWAEAIFAIIAKLPEARARIITHDMGDVTVWEKAVALAKDRGMKAEIIDHLMHAKAFYEVCRTNRNLYVHAAGSAAAKPGLTLVRRKGPRLFGSAIPDGIEDMRRVGEDIRTLIKFMDALALSIFDAEPGKVQPLPLPKKPILPEPLLKPPPRTPKARPRQQRSSRASRRSQGPA